MYAVFYLVISLAQFETVVPWQQLIELLPAEIDELDNVTSAGDQPSSALNDNGVEHTESSSQQNAESAVPGSEILSGSLNREFEQRSLLNQPLPAIAPAEVPESNGEQRVIIERVARLQQRIVISWVLIAALFLIQSRWLLVYVVRGIGLYLRTSQTSQRYTRKGPDDNTDSTETPSTVSFPWWFAPKCRQDHRDRSTESVGEHTIPEPTEQVKRFVEAINCLPNDVSVSVANEPWQSGWARHIGPVRERQEDYVLTFQVGKIFVALLADGAGGHPGGQESSYRAIIGAATSITQTLAAHQSLQLSELERIARQGVIDASFSIAIEAAAQGMSMRESMRSTLIVILATEEGFSWANCGDGGAWLIQATPRRFESFLVPAKGVAPNLLTASLGPQIVGEIVTGRRSWGQADFIVIASDGVADVIETEQFFNVCLASSLQNDGDFTKSAETVLELLAASPGVSDNLSIGLIGRSRRPVLAA